jgi:hypothetical protein
MELGGMNLYKSFRNNPLLYRDRYGLQIPEPDIEPIENLPLWDEPEFDDKDQRARFLKALLDLSDQLNIPIYNPNPVCRFFCPPNKCPGHLISAPLPPPPPPPPIWPGAGCSTCHFNIPPIVVSL